MTGNIRISILPIVGAIVLTSALLCLAPSAAISFPFRSVNPGDRLPGITVQSLDDRHNVDLSQYAGKPLVLIFFGADIPTKKERSVRALKAIQKMAPLLASKGVVTLMIDAQGDGEEVIKSVIAEAATTFPVFMDGEHQAYGNLGIFVMPSIMLVAANGTVAAGMGYSHDLGPRLKGEIEVMLGEKSRAQVEEELRPAMVERPEAEKGADRYFNLGLTLIARGQPEAARRELLKAVELDPKMGRAQVQLGCLELEAGQLAAAGVSLAKGMALVPDDLPGKLCQARLKARQGDLAAAVGELKALQARNYRDPELHHVLGSLLEASGDVKGAMREYRTAYELLAEQAREK